MRRRKVVAILATLVGLAAGALLVASPAQARFNTDHEIINAITGKCADVADKSNDPGHIVHEWTCADDNNQLWIPDQVGNGYLVYHNRKSQLCLNVRDGAAVAGTVVEQQYCDRSQPSQWWRWLGADDIGHLVLNSGLGNLCLALEPYSSRNGTAIVVNDCATTSGQMWYTD